MSKKRSGWRSFRKYCERKIANIAANNPTRTFWISDVPIAEYGTLSRKPYSGDEWMK